MPILDITTKHSAGSGLPRVAKLHKGSEKHDRQKPDGTPYQIVGKDLPHFRVAFAEGYEYLSDAFAQMYGEEPTEIPVMFHADKVHEALDAWYEEWNSSGTMLHRCDGARQAVCFNTSTGFFEHNLPCAMSKCKCKKVARLELIVLGFMDATGVLGTITFETHSDQDIRTLYARLSSYYAMFGTLRGIPFVLTRAPKETSAPKMNGNQRTGERVKVTRSMVDLIVDPEFVRAHIKSFTRTTLPQGQAAPSTPALPPAPAANNVPQLPPHWTADSKRWQGFLDWAAKFGQTPADVLRALEEDVQTTVAMSTDYTGSERAAMGAVLAAVCTYEPERIKKWTLKGLTPEAQTAVREQALRITQQRHDDLMSMVDTDPIPGAEIAEGDAQ